MQNVTKTGSFANINSVQHTSGYAFFAQKVSLKEYILTKKKPFGLNAHPSVSPITETLAQ